MWLSPPSPPPSSSPSGRISPSPGGVPWHACHLTGNPGTPPHSGELRPTPTHITAEGRWKNTAWRSGWQWLKHQVHCVPVYFLKTRPLFRAVLGSQQNGAEGTEIFPHIPCFHTYTASPIINISHQSGAFVAMDVPALIDTSLPPRVHGLHQGSLLALCTLWILTNGK